MSVNSFCVPVPLNVSSAGTSKKLADVWLAVPSVSVKSLLPAPSDDVAVRVASLMLDVVLPPAIVNCVTMPPLTESTCTLVPSFIVICSSAAYPVPPTNDPSFVPLSKSV